MYFIHSLLHSKVTTHFNSNMVKGKVRKLYLNQIEHSWKWRKAKEKVKYDNSTTVVCPSCGEDVHIGSAGPAGLAQHEGKGPCRTSWAAPQDARYGGNICLYLWKSWYWRKGYGLGHRYSLRIWGLWDFMGTPLFKLIFVINSYLLLKLKFHLECLNIDCALRGWCCENHASRLWKRAQVA